MKAKTYALDDIIVVVMRGSGFTPPSPHSRRRLALLTPWPHPARPDASCPCSLTISSQAFRDEKRPLSPYEPTSTRLTRRSRGRSVESALYMTVRGSPQRHRWEADVTGPAATRSRGSEQSWRSHVRQIKQACCAPREPRDANGTGKTAPEPRHPKRPLPITRP